MFFYISFFVGLHIAQLSGVNKLLVLFALLLFGVSLNLSMCRLQFRSFFDESSALLKQSNVKIQNSSGDITSAYSLR